MVRDVQVVHWVTADHVVAEQYHCVQVIKYLSILPGGKVFIGREGELKMKRKAKGVSEVLEKDPDGSKILDRKVFVSNSEIKAEKKQPDHEVKRGKWSL